MEDHELARRAELGLNVEQIKKCRALNRNINMSDLKAYMKVFHLASAKSSRFSGRSPKADRVSR